MKKIITLLTICVIALASCTKVSPTEVGFPISNSGSYRGIDSIPTVTGYQWYMPGFTYIVTIPTTQQHVVWTQTGEGNTDDEAITISCMGGAGFKVDVGLNYRVDPNKASKIYLRYRTGDLETITQTYIRNIVRGSMQDISGVITVDSVLNNLPAFEHAAAANITERLGREGFIVDNFSILAQPIPTDKALAASINAKIKARQDAERTKMEVQISQQEAQKAIATAQGDSASKVIRAAGEAEAVKKIQTVLTPTYVDYIKANQWDGKLPGVMSGSGGMMLNLKQN